MAAFFSGQDDREESMGFRVYAVIGKIGTPSEEIITRVGIYGHFGFIKAEEVFECLDFCGNLLIG
jgi:hypothetical protein